MFYAERAAVTGCPLVCVGMLKTGEKRRRIQALLLTAKKATFCDSSAGAWCRWWGQAAATRKLPSCRERALGLITIWTSRPSRFRK